MLVKGEGWGYRLQTVIALGTAWVLQADKPDHLGEVWYSLGSWDDVQECLFTHVQQRIQ